MSFILRNIEKNVIQITNEDLVDPINYTIYVVDTEGTFEPVESFPTDPTNIIAAGGQLQYDLVNDGVYKLIIDNSPSANSEYYFLLDYNIRTCQKKLIEDLYCRTCKCEAKKEALQIKQLIKFNSLKESYYFYWNQWVQTQSVTDLIVPPTDEILYVSDVLRLLGEICKGCGKTKNCGC